ncbi:hypothetical protein B0J14DRAFT_351916 [Halenospora varia]|nr:hypothetical protein B0J14DRAFT_351916 [Halenospora varia]
MTSTSNECISDANVCAIATKSVSTVAPQICWADSKGWKTCPTDLGPTSLGTGACLQCVDAKQNSNTTPAVTTPTTISTPTPTPTPTSTPKPNGTPATTAQAGAAGTAATSTPTGSSSPASTSKGVPAGAVAGVAIGCFLIGALLAGLIVFFVFRRKRQRNAYPQQHLPPGELTYVGHEKHGMTATTLGSGAGAVVTNVDRLLPQPAEDDAIVGGLSKIRDGIKNHVQNYYHNSPINHEAVNEATLAELANATGIPTSSLKTLLLTPATRTPTIMVFLGQLILSRCVGRTDGQASFLPAEISRVVSPPASANSSQLALFSKWKTISGALLQQQYGQQPGENDPRDATIAQALAAAEPILHPFINPSVDAAARRRNLEGVLKRAAQFAFLLFSQPGCFQFDYTGTGQADSLVVFPAMIQTVSDEAERLSPPRVLSAKEIMTGLGA